MSPILDRLRTGLKSVATMLFPRQSSWSWSNLVGRSRYNFAAEVGDGRGSSMVVAVLKWIGKNFPEAKPQVVKLDPDGAYQPVEGHALTNLLRRPNPFYSGITLFMATLADWKLGNAYWLKVRSGAGLVVELWWIPSFMMEPKWPDDGRTFISHYEYKPNTTAERVDVADVVHFRNGIDPNNMRKGLSDLGSLLREIATDEEAASFTAAILRNLGVPGVIISPDGDTSFDPESVDQAKAQFAQRFGNDRRGEPMVVTAKTKVQVLSFSPEQMDLKALRRIPEERVTAVLGVAAIVAGLGAGLDRSTFANYAEAREAATEGELVPDWTFFAEEIRAQLLPDFEDLERADFRFDLSQVRTLQPDQNALWERANNALKSGGITLNQSLQMRGLPEVDDGDVLYLPIGVTVTPLENLAAAPGPSSGDGAAGDGEPTATGTRGLAPLEVKSARDVVPAIRKLRASLQTGAERDMQRYLNGCQRRVLAALRDATKDVADRDVFDADDEAARLRELLRPHYLRALTGVSGVVQDALSVDFTIDDPLTTAYLREAGQQITGITDTTRRAISQALAEGQAAGESYTGLAQRIRELTEWNANRARMVARTELGASTNSATLYAYEASGVVVGVRWFDGTDHEPCAGLNGKTMTLDEARAVPPLAHPNCIRAAAPLTSRRQLEGRSNGNGHLHKDELRELVAA